MAKPKIIFFNINGSGMGHLTRCLAYARRLQEDADCVFFSLASAIEIIEEMGFSADYFVSHFWSANSSYAWNSELALRFGLFLETVRPDVVVFDGVWPYQGFLTAIRAYKRKKPVLIWSNRGLLKEGQKQSSVDQSIFDLILQPGELNMTEPIQNQLLETNRLPIPPVSLLRNDEILSRTKAREALGLSQEGRYVLFSLGPGNLKDIDGIGQGLIQQFKAANYQIAWAKAPISVKDVDLPVGIIPIQVYPLVRYLRAFDVFVAAAGYNTCCEVAQVGLPTLFVPNDELADDQVKRAYLVTERVAAVVSPCQTPAQQAEAVATILAKATKSPEKPKTNNFEGAELAAEAILQAFKNKRGWKWILKMKSWF